MKLFFHDSQTSMSDPFQQKHSKLYQNTDKTHA